MTLTDYVRRIVQRWRVIVVSTLVLIAIATVITFSTTPKYESTARVFVSSSSGIEDLGTQLASGVYAQQKVLSYAAVASSVPMAEAVIADLSLSMSPVDLAREIKTSVEYGTVLVTFVVTDSSGERATAIAQSILSNYDQVLAKIDSTKDGSIPVTVSVMEPATLPTSAVSPKIGLNIIAALVAGLLIGIALAALRDLIDDTIKTQADLEALELPSLGNIPVRNKKFRDRGADALTLVSFSENTPTAEAFRQLRVNVQFASLDGQPRKLLVTSSGPGEGKSFISANLAAVYAATGLRVALVDLDLRRPVLAERLGLEKSVGVTTVLLGRATLEESLQAVHGTSLSLLATGKLPPNPADMLSTQAVADVIDKLAVEFDVVILDTPPAGMFADARQLAAQVDGVIVVSRHKESKRAALLETIKRLRAVDATVLGVIINRAPILARGEYDQYGYSTYTEPKLKPRASTRRRA